MEHEGFYVSFFVNCIIAKERIAKNRTIFIFIGHFLCFAEFLAAQLHGESGILSKQKSRAPILESGVVAIIIKTSTTAMIPVGAKLERLYKICVDRILSMLSYKQYT